MTAQTGFLELPDAKLYYEVEGEGHPLTLIHAGVADHRMWDEQVSEFSKYYRVIRYDERGAGQTRSETKEGYSDVTDLYALLKYLGVEKTHLIGLSRGGGIAIDFTLTHPEMVSVLIPVAAGISGAPFDASKFTEAERDYANEIEKVDASGDMVRLNDLEVHLWMDGLRRVGPPVDAAAREKLSQMNYASLTHPDGLLRPGKLERPAIDRLGEIKVPTFVIWGDGDVSTVLAQSQQMVNEIPGAKSLVFPDVAHMVNMERPIEFNRAVLDFLKQIGG